MYTCVYFTTQATVPAHRTKIWKEKRVLNVYFMNPGDIEVWGWRCRGKPVSINTIIAWARVWNYPEIPNFEVVDKAKKADIRVCFSGNNSNNYLTLYNNKVLFNLYQAQSLLCMY